MYKVKHVAISVFIIIGACSFALALTTSATEHLKAATLDITVDINNKSEPIPPITEINNGSYVPPQPTVNPTVNPNVTTSTPAPTTPTSTNTTTAPTSTSSTPASTTSVPTTTVKPTITPNVTTAAPNVTTIAPNTTTPIPVTTVKPTTAPPTPVPSHRRFDGPSFIGGIVLALGLVAIGFVAFKFYKARTELNYHTL